MLELDLPTPPAPPPIEAAPAAVRRHLLAFFALAPALAAAASAGAAAWELAEPRTAVAVVEPRCEANECALSLPRRGPAATLELEVASPLPAGAVWEVCRGKACRATIPTPVQGRVALSAAGADRGERLVIRLRGDRELRVPRVRVVAAWLGWGAVVRRAAKVPWLGRVAREDAPEDDR